MYSRYFWFLQKNRILLRISGTDNGFDRPFGTGASLHRYPGTSHLYVFSLLNRPGRPVVLRTRSHRTLRDGSLGGVFPGTSCQATIAPSLRDNSQQALARCCCEMSAIASRRDDTDRSLARSAWETVPRKNRPVGYGMIGYEGQQREGLGQDAKQI